MTKISALPQQSSPTTADKAVIVSGGVTDYVLLSDLVTLFFNNIPAGAHSDVTRYSETGYDFVASGCVWSGDAYASTKAASLTTGYVYINGRRILVSAVTARVFTASKDTYIDILDNTDGTGTIVYTEVTNNAASPALAANSIRIGIIVTGATNIASAGSVNQGQVAKALPIASSNAYEGTESLGNLICCRDPDRRILGERTITSCAATSASNTDVDVTGLDIFPVIVPANRRVRLTAEAMFDNTAATGLLAAYIKESATALNLMRAAGSATGGWYIPAAVEYSGNPSSGLHTYKFSFHREAGTSTFSVPSGPIARIKAELA